jgi:hypothetical protein
LEENKLEVKRIIKPDPTRGSAQAVVEMSEDESEVDWDYWKKEAEKLPRDPKGLNDMLDSHPLFASNDVCFCFLLSPSDASLCFLLVVLLVLCNDRRSPPLPT